MLKILFFFLGMFAKAQAGSWTSSGGELAGVAYNPWFLQNTSEVTYCLATDQGLGFDDTTLNDIFQRALFYWRQEFAGINSPQGEQGSRVILGTQTYVRVTCSAKTDLTVRIGKNVSHAEQARTPQQTFVAYTALQRYNRGTMQGQGTITIGGPTLEATLVLEDRELLYRVLVHELGHVHGIPHTSRYPDEVMDTRFVQFSIEHRKQLHKFPLPGYFLNRVRPYGQTQECRFPHAFPYARNFFQIPPHLGCFRWKVDGRGTLQVLGRENLHGSEVILARGQLLESTLDHFETPIAVFLPPTQRVFPAYQGRTGVLWGPRRAFETLAGKVTIHNGTLRPMFFSDAAGDQHRIGGFDGQTLVPNLLDKGGSQPGPAPL